VLARAGFGSRRACEELIADGRVAIDGVTARLGDRVDAERQSVTLDGTPVVTRTDLVYYVLNKPAGVVTTAADPVGRATVIELVPDDPRVFPVGRLDYETEGLLVLTNDGDLAQRLTHPSHGVTKTYLADVEGVPAPSALRALREGLTLDDGPTAPAKVQLLQDRDGHAAVELTIHEGRNRQVRRMLDTVGHPVRRLVRTRIGPLHDTRLAPGEWRSLTLGEVRGLYEASSGRGTTPGAAGAGH
jgi:23S rRNA pseudouridine2605 synthase